jgi:hypothetical protein
MNREMGWALARVGKGQRTCREETTRKDPNVDGRIILEWMLGKLGGRIWSGFIWLRIGNGDGIL